MERKIVIALLVLTSVAAGLNAGFFYTWSFTIMQSLNLAGEVTATESMNAINANIRNAWFGAIFFGAPALIAISLVAAWLKFRNALWWVLPAFIFAVLTLVITFSQHIPLNNELAGGLMWSQYYPDWVTWNHARMCTSVLSFVFMLLAALSYASAVKR
ncbi:MAG: DUF1772 domain-containing protein [Thiolinea sp.]